MERNEEVSPETDNFDSILLVIVEDLAENWLVKHYEHEQKSAALHIIDRKLLEEWIDTSSYRRAIEWIIDGRVIYDRNLYVKKFKGESKCFS